MDIASLRQAHFEHWRLAAAIRTLTLDAVAAANSGHSGMPMGMADVATVLFDKHLRFDPKAPFWPDRDRFILSAGHGSMLLYSLLYLTGYPDMTLEQIRDFRQWESRTPGHPEVHHTAGVETTTGPLGQGLANSVGFAIAEEALRARFGAKVMDHHTYVIAGDGCLMEGVSQEALALAGRQQLSRLIVLFDDNGITIDGKVSLSDATDQGARFAASGWHVQAIDGHDPGAIDAAITAAKADPRPSMIACKTHIALGSSAQDTSKGHGALTDAKLVADTKAVYGWEHAAFEVPADIKARWEQMGSRGAQARAEWEERVAALPAARQAEFRRQCDPGCEAGGHRREACRHAQVVGDGAGGGERRHARNAGRVGRPDGVEQHPHQGHGRLRAGEPQGPLHLLRHPRAWDGGRDERHGAARRRPAIWRHLHVLCRLCAPVDAAVGADGGSGRLCDDA
jgi:transketolase